MSSADHQPRSDGADVEEAALVAALQRGEDAAYERMVREYGGRLLAVARRLLRNDEDAQDALQDGLISAARAIGNFAGESRLSTWLHRIVVNAALMKARSRARRHETQWPSPSGSEQPIESLLPRFLADGHQATPAAEWSEPAHVAMQRRETRAWVRATIDRLPESYRTVLILRDIEELDTRETAEVLGIEPNAVKVRLHRARQALRGLLDEKMK